jgi:hypothetical protein
VDLGGALHFWVLGSSLCICRWSVASQIWANVDSQCEVAGVGGAWRARVCSLVVDTHGRCAAGFGGGEGGETAAELPGGEVAVEGDTHALWGLARSVNR